VCPPVARSLLYREQEEKEMAKEMAKDVVVANKPWWQSKEIWTLAGTILATIGGVVSGEVSIQAGILPLVGEISTLIIRLFFTKTNLTR
jgi:hypothetical protein